MRSNDKPERSGGLGRRELRCRLKHSKRCYDDAVESFDDRMKDFFNILYIVKKGESNMNEVWKKVENSSRYEVSNFGNVRDKKKNGKFLEIYIERNHKYVYLMLDQGGSNRKRSVGLLVGQAFVEKPSFDCSKVRYKDGNYLNCEASNIAWIPSKKSAQLRKSRRLAEASEWGYRQHAAGNPMKICIERECGGIRGFFHFEGDGAFFLGISLARMRRVLNGEETLAGWRVTKI